jgi:hypothetical protein
VGMSHDRYFCIGENWRDLLAEGRITQADVELLVRVSEGVDRTLEVEETSIDGSSAVVVRCDDAVVSLAALRAAYYPAEVLRAKLFAPDYIERPDEAERVNPP